ncbi:hypothetical protein KI387_035240, partial [Taxus chinensis]
MPHAQNPPQPSVIPPTVKEVVEIDTLHVLRSLTDTLAQHSSQITSSDVGGGTSSSTPHHCGSCGVICITGETSFAGSHDLFFTDLMMEYVFGSVVPNVTGLSQ